MSIGTENSKSAFDSFLISNSNSELFNCMHSVARNVDEVKNPIFVYGPNMTGKTELAFAVIQEYKKNNKRTLYTTSEKLIYSMCDYCHTKSRKEFDWLLDLDLLVIDNLFNVGGKKATQKFMAKIISGLTEVGTQVIIISDVEPRYWRFLKDELYLLSDLRIVSVKKPDLVLKKLFLEKCLADIELTVEAKTKVFLVKHCASNFMELQGALKSVLIRSRTEHKEITHDFIVDSLSRSGQNF